jgi:hypothetical protein
VTAAGAASNKADITRAITAALFGIAGVQSVAFQTGRRGLVRKAARIGYRQIGTVHNGVIMRKVIDVGND